MLEPAISAPAAVAPPIQAARALRAVLTVRSVRLATGLTLFTYVCLHLTNHTLGNISIPAMEAGLLIQKWIWQGVLGTIILYIALSTHYGLGLWALYERRHFGWTRTEVVQVVFGMAIPFLLMNHLYATRISLAQFGTEKGYAQELYSFWVAAPHLGVLQLSVLIVAWIHGCIGVYQWLRLKTFFDHVRPFLLCAAIMLPLLALLGYYRGGQTLLALAHDPAWRQANLNPWQVGTPTQNAQLRFERDTSLLAALGLFIAVLLARGVRALRERRSGTVRVTYPDGRVARIPLGFTILEASRSAQIPHASVCGGRARCSTCRVRVTVGRARTPAPSDLEQAVLTRIAAGPNVRLACQLRPTSDVSVVPLLPSYWDAAALRKNTIPLPGEERFIVSLVVDMRDSTQLAESRLPFDAVFIVDRFVNAIGAAVNEAGGRPNQFTGDGLIAAFGLNCGPKLACRQAMDALALIGRNIAGLNRVLISEMAEPIRFGIGVHGSAAVVGEIGYAESRVFTTLGEAANIATRLEALCKDFHCQAVVSQAVFAMSDCQLDLPAPREVTVRGREAPLAVRVIDSVMDLHVPVADQPRQLRPMDARI